MTQKLETLLKSNKMKLILTKVLWHQSILKQKALDSKKACSLGHLVGKS